MSYDITYKHLILIRCLASSSYTYTILHFFARFKSWYELVLNLLLTKLRHKKNITKSINRNKLVSVSMSTCRHVWYPWQLASGRTASVLVD